MSQPFEEQLSAFMDGELGRDESRFLLRRAEGDDVLAGRWMRYHVARNVLRRQPVIAIRADFSSAILAKLNAETVAETGRVQWLRWGSGGAIAAAVAVAALMVTKPSTEPEVTTPIAASATPQRATQVAAPVTAQVAAASPALQAPLVPNSPIQTQAASFGSDLSEPVTYDPRLQSYVIRHYQALGTTSQSDFVPYILLAQPASTAERPAENR
ncbi:MAG TPA: sigma-E factor negative regulatory protein [Rhodanobacteraceae bacterium]|nr:sigma-E factor negative regulatory protein [Rhodanobacteraceae bacterium]